jgi:hypothetical protein
MNGRTAVGAFLQRTDPRRLDEMPTLADVPELGNVKRLQTVPAFHIK